MRSHWRRSQGVPRQLQRRLPPHAIDLSPSHRRTAKQACHAARGPTPRGSQLHPAPHRRSPGPVTSPRVNSQVCRSLRTTNPPRYPAPPRTKTFFIHDRLSERASTCTCVPGQPRPCAGRLVGASTDRPSALPAYAVDGVNTIDVRYRATASPYHIVRYVATSRSAFSRRPSECPESERRRPRRPTEKPGALGPSPSAFSRCRTPVSDRRSQPSRPDAGVRSPLSTIAARGLSSMSRGKSTRPRQRLDS